MVAAAVIGAAVVGGGASIISGNKAANAATQAADKSAELQKYQYDTTRADYAPWRTVGQNALSKLAKLYGVQGTAPTTPASSTSPFAYSGGIYGNFTGDAGGSWSYNSSTGQWQQGPAQGGGQSITDAALPTQTAPANDDPFADFYASPDYKFRLSEGMKAIERSAAARGALRSGATMKAVGDYSQGVAAGEYGNYVNRLASLAGVGQTATDSTSAAGQNYANGASNAYTNAGNARASAYANTGNAINNTVGNIASMYLYQQGYKGGN